MNRGSPCQVHALLLHGLFTTKWSCCIQQVVKLDHLLMQFSCTKTTCYSALTPSIAHIMCVLKPPIFLDIRMHSQVTRSLQFH